MNPSHEIDIEFKMTAVRVQAALELVPRILGPKEAWAPWMRNNLAAEIRGKNPRPSASSPHPRILGSLRRMLGRHYKTGMSMDTLVFSDVRDDDPMITDPYYVDIPVDQLPDLNGSDFWWNVLPPSVTLSVPEEPRPVDPKDLDTPRMTQDLKGKRRLSSPVPEPWEPPTKKKKRKLQEITVVSAEAEGKAGSKWKAEAPDVPVRRRNERRACTIRASYNGATAGETFPELIAELSERVAGLEKLLAFYEEKEIQIATTFARLQLRVQRLKKDKRALTTTLPFGS